MEHIKSILKGVPDRRRISSHDEGTPVRLLYQDYAEKAEHDSTLPRITMRSTGIQLKNAICELDHDDAVLLLHSYLVNIEQYEPMAKVMLARTGRDDRALKHWLVRAGVWTMAPIMLLVVGAILFVTVKTGVVSENSALNSIVTTGMEILKLIFTSATK